MLPCGYLRIMTTRLTIPSNLPHILLYTALSLRTTSSRGHFYLDESIGRVRCLPEIRCSSFYLAIAPSIH